MKKPSITNSILLSAALFSGACATTPQHIAQIQQHIPPAQVKVVKTQKETPKPIEIGPEDLPKYIVNQAKGVPPREYIKSNSNIPQSAQRNLVNKEGFENSEQMFYTAFISNTPVTEKAAPKTVEKKVETTVKKKLDYGSLVIPPLSLTMNVRTVEPGQRTGPTPNPTPTPAPNPQPVPTAGSFKANQYLHPRDTFSFKTKSVCFENAAYCPPDKRGKLVFNAGEFSATTSFPTQRWPECTLENVAFKSVKGYPAEVFCLKNGMWWLIEESLDWNRNLNGRTFLSRGSNPNQRTGVTPVYAWVPENAVSGQSVLIQGNAAIQDYTCGQGTLIETAESGALQNHRAYGPFDLLTQKGRDDLVAMLIDPQTTPSMVVPPELYTSVPTELCETHGGVTGLKAIVIEDWWGPFNADNLCTSCADPSVAFREREAHTYLSATCADGSIHPTGRLGHQRRSHTDPYSPMLLRKSRMAVSLKKERGPVYASPPCE